MEASKIIYRIPKGKQEELIEALVKQGYDINQNSSSGRFPDEAPLHIHRQGIAIRIGGISGNSITLDGLLGFEGQPEEAKKASQELNIYLSNLNI